MGSIFDGLGYAKRLRDGGLPQAQAEAHAGAARDYIMVELATKSDLLAMKQELQAELRTRISDVEFRSSISELRGSFIEVRNAIEAETLRLTVRFGLMLAVWVWIAAIILKRP